MLKAKFNLSSPHLLEQVAYRQLQCANDCVLDGKCKHCECPLPDRHFTTASCDKERFPNLMGRFEWEQFKRENNI